MLKVNTKPKLALAVTQILSLDHFLIGKTHEHYGNHQNVDAMIEDLKSSLLKKLPCIEQNSNRKLILRILRNIQS